MSINEALLIRELKKRCTYRRLAEVYYPVKDKRNGVQSYGEDLCKDAFSTIYPIQNMYDVKPVETLKQFKKYTTFVSDNISYVGVGFWWWE